MRSPSPSLSTLAVLLAAVVSPVVAGTKEIWWNITYVEDANPDGLYPRRVIGVNGTWPYVILPPPPSLIYLSVRARTDVCVGVEWYRPPMIEVNSTDDLLVHALNSLDEPTSIHHHGMFFNSTSWMDGAVMVSQWFVFLSISTFNSYYTILLMALRSCFILHCAHY